MRLEALDHRDDHTWVAIELSPLGETKVEEGTLVKVLRSDLEVGEDYPIFIPSIVYQKGGKRVSLHLMEGYAFVVSGLPETRYFALEQKPYVTQVMSTRGGPYRMRTPSVISDAHIQDLQRQLRKMVSSDIEVGARIFVLDGLYKGLDGEVLGIENEEAFVLVELRSIKIIATVPLVFLESREA